MREKDSSANVMRYGHGLSIEDEGFQMYGMVFTSLDVFFFPFQLPLTTFTQADDSLSFPNNRSRIDHSAGIFLQSQNSKDFERIRFIQNNHPNRTDVEGFGVQRDVSKDQHTTTLCVAKTNSHELLVLDVKFNKDDVFLFFHRQ